jgi:hypothetical protein
MPNRFRINESIQKLQAGLTNKWRAIWQFLENEFQDIGRSYKLKKVREPGCEWRTRKKLELEQSCTYTNISLSNNFKAESLISQDRCNKECVSREHRFWIKFYTSKKKKRNWRLKLKHCSYLVGQKTFIQNIDETIHG